MEAWLTVRAERSGSPIRIWRSVRTAAACVAMVCAAVLGMVSCQSCRAPVRPVVATTETSPPTLRLYLMSDVSGALEPCGCVKDQLGGLDHLAAWVGAERKRVPNDLLLSVGPLFFMDSDLKEERRAQDLAKADTLATALHDVGLVAFAPGDNDFAAGEAMLSTLREKSGAAMLVANASASGSVPSLLVERGGVKIGLIGVRAVAGSTAAVEAVRAEQKKLREGGAEIVVALASVGRGEAKRIADAVPDLHAIVVGSARVGGEVNSEAPPGERLGNVFVVETGNHLTSVAVLDFYVRGGSYAFADGTGADQEKKKVELLRRIGELRGKIAAWEQAGKISRTDLEARRGDLARLEEEKRTLDEPPAPVDGSFARYFLREVREEMGRDPSVKRALRSYYKQINEANKHAFASKLPRPAPSGEPSFIGVDACTTCHLEERKVWDNTAHSRAYATLATDFKEYNLDCVSCHVTGYDQPGGSTVVHVEKLQAVQCEVCHGPGSKHAASPKAAHMPQGVPKPEMCTACHHPPHVHVFNAVEKMPFILGPGHGMK